MKSIESKVPQFYDVLDDEIQKVRQFYEDLLVEAKKMGFLEIETTAIELKERYVNATSVHFSKIFEVQRTKQGNQFALQADLAMSMSRFISDFPQFIPNVKLIQLGKMYRDRIYNLPGYRREFKQILLGEWGEDSLYADAEVVYLAYKSLKNIEYSSISYIEISNFNIFDSIFCGLAEKIRFNGIEYLKYSDLSVGDVEVLTNLYKNGRINFENVKEIFYSIESHSVKVELQKVIEVFEYLTKIFKIRDKIYFSLNNLEGTGHYSGLHYRIYIKVNGSEYLIGDGGRIDTLCEKFNKNREIPAVCMGIGIQVLAQICEKELQKKDIVILINEKLIKEKWNIIIEIQRLLPDYNISVIPQSPNKKTKFFKSDFYYGCNYIFIFDDKIEIRTAEKEDKENLINKLNEILH